MDGVATPPWDSSAEVRMSLLLASAVLVALTVAKALAPIAYVGPLALTAAAFLQLYWPVSRADRRDATLWSLGLTWSRWQADTRLALTVLAVILPPYALCYHWFITALQPALVAHGWLGLARYMPHAAWAPHLPKDGMAWLMGLGWFGERIATHTLGVALPEEVFYRGYLQPCLMWRWPPRWGFCGTPVGRAVVASAALFALGHFLGEWQPLRLGPFFPGLLFGWLRNRSGTVMSAIGVHAGCNVFVEVFSRLYVLT